MATLEPGQSFGRFNIINFVREDNLGTVYKAYDSNGARDVQLTLLRSTLAAQAGFAERFAAITQPLLSLAHPNLLQLLDAGEVDGSFYLVSPAVDSQTLADRQAGGGIAPPDIQRIVAQVGAALEYLHGKGITHGALSPEKILVDSNGNALVGGFGLAGLTAQPAAEPADKSGDAFALALILAGLLTGSAALAANAVAPDMFHELVSSLPTDKATAVASAYAAVLQKALALDPASRFGSVAELLAAWQQAGGMVSGPAAPASERPSALATPPDMSGSRPPAPILVPPIVPPIITPPVSLGKPTPPLSTPTTNPPTPITPSASKPDASQAAARQALIDDSMRLVQEIAEQRAGSKLTPEQRRELARLMHTVRDIADKRARGELNAHEQRAALTDLVRQLKTVRPQDVDAAPTAEALAGARAEAVREVSTAKQVAAGSTDQVKRAGKGAARAVFVGFGVLFFVVVVCPLACLASVVLQSDATPTARPPVTAAKTATPLAPPTRANTASATRVLPATPAGASRNTPAAAVPTLAPLVTRPIFTDTFDSGNCNLPEGDNSSRTVSCTNNEYVILNKTSTSRWFYYDDEYTDLALEADVRFESGPSTTEYGLLWHVASDGESFYGLTLRSNGTMSIFTYRNSNYDYFTRGFTVQGFKSGQNAKNHLKIMMQGGQMSFEVNDQSQVLTLKDSKLNSGTVGLIVTGSPQNSKVAYSNLVVSEFAPPVVPGPVASPTR
jgi:serine/threonine-protein kinase